MAFIPFANAALAVVKYSWGTMSWSNTAWFDYEGFGALDQQALGDAIMLSAVTHLKAAMAQSTNLVGVTVYDMRTETGAVTNSITGAGAGATAQDLVPLNTAICMTVYSAARGRSGRVRMYFAGFTEGHIASGSWTQSCADSVENFAGSMKSAVEVLGWEWVVASRYHNHAPRTVGVTYPVTSFDVRSLLATTQRRRIDRP